MAVKLKEHLQIHLNFSNYLEPSLIWSDGNVFADKAKNLCFDWSDKCGNFCCHELVKFILTILKRNISPLKLQINVSAHAQIDFVRNRRSFRLMKIHLKTSFKYMFVTRKISISFFSCYVQKQPLEMFYRNKCF